MDFDKTMFFKVEKNKEIAVSVSEDGSYGSDIYNGSGRTLSKTIRQQLKEYSSNVVVLKNNETLNDFTDEEIKNYDYIVIPEILHWEDRATAWSGIPDKIEVSIEIYDSKRNLLKSAIPDTKLNHTYEELQFVPIFDTNGYLSPGYYQSIAQVLIPKMSLIARYMYYNTTLLPTYILCGIKTSAILESLQEFIFTYPQMRAGLAGYNNKYGDKTINRSSFRSYKIIMSHAIPEDDLYMLYKPTTKDEEVYSNIVNFIYKPLYLVEEITNGKKRVFIKTRNSVELLNTSTIGYIYLPDINQYLSTSDYSPNPQHWF